jgi:hypothetical protein
MVYVSTTTKPVNSDSGTLQVDVGRILMQARKNNPTDKIGGVLYFSNNYYFQCLEGDQEAVNKLYNKILNDPRHENVQTVSVKLVSNRMFANWSMKYVAPEYNIERLLKENGFTIFNPYVFNEEMIEKMLALFAKTEDQTGDADQNYAKTDDVKDKQGFFSRLLKGRKAA